MLRVTGRPYQLQFLPGGALGLRADSAPPRVLLGLSGGARGGGSEGAPSPVRDARCGVPCHATREGYNGDIIRNTDHPPGSHPPRGTGSPTRGTKSQLPCDPDR